MEKRTVVRYSFPWFTVGLVYWIVYNCAHLADQHNAVLDVLKVIAKIVVIVPLCGVGILFVVMLVLVLTDRF